MSITYNDIINILCNDDSKFSTNLNIMNFINNDNYFYNLLNGNFYRYGIHIYNNNYENISFISSILYCLDSNYNYNDKNLIFNQIKDIQNFIKNDVDIINYLNLNILIFDFKNNIIKTLYNGDYFNPYRETIFLANYDNYWEPICNKDNNTFNIENSKCNILKKILSCDIEYYNDNKIFVLNDNINEILDEILKFNNQKLLVDENSFTTKNTIYSNLTENKLKKMKKDQILEIINDLNIDIGSLQKTNKDILIKLILSK